MIDPTDPEELLKIAIAVTEQYLKQRQLVSTPKEIKTMMAYLLTTIKTIYQIEWTEALSFLDQFCTSYVLNISSSATQQKTDKPTLN